MLAAPTSIYAKVEPFKAGPATFRRRSAQRHPARVAVDKVFIGSVAAHAHTICRRSHLQPSKRSRRNSVKTFATSDPLVPLGLDFLTFLAATVLVIPLFKSVKASPVLGFLFTGLILGQLG